MYSHKSLLLAKQFQMKINNRSTLKRSVENSKMCLISKGSHTRVDGQFSAMRTLRSKCCLISIDIVYTCLIFQYKGDTHCRRLYTQNALFKLKTIGSKSTRGTVNNQVNTQGFQMIAATIHIKGPLQVVQNNRSISRTSSSNTMALLLLTEWVQRGVKLKF